MQIIADVHPSLPQRAAVPYPKVRVPAASTTLVVRPRLLDLVSGRDPGEGGAGPDLTFVCAPAGSGKTTLLAEWAQRRRRRGDGIVAWVSLESGDNDVHQFWSAVLTAIDAGTAPGAESPVGTLGAPGHGFPLAFLSAFVDAVDRCPVPVHLVLDDVHEVHDLETLHSLDLLLRSLPARLRVIMSGRFVPALPLPRLRLDGRLNEIGAAHLGFTASEAETLLGAHGVHLAPADLDVLLERTEGWAAGLRLAAMSLAEASDPAALIANFATDDRAVADYLVGEVLARRPEPIRQFLLATSVCERITADLARELSGREDAGAVLDDLERSNSFIVRLGRRGSWYRYHPMLRAYLHAELARQSQERARAQHRTAAHWFAARNEMLEAIEHAVDAVDADLTATLVEDHGLQLVLRGEGARLRQVLAGATTEVAGRPGVALVAATTALEVGEPAAADAALARMHSMGAGGPLGSRRLRGLELAIALQRARLAGDSGAAAAALAGTVGPTGAPELDLLVLVHRGAARAWLGDLDSAEAELRRALTTARATGREWLLLQCLAHLGAVAAARTDMAEASVLAREAMSLATHHGWTRSVPAAGAALVLGWAAYQRLDDETVTATAPHVALLAASHDPSTALAAAVHRAVVEFDRGDDRHAAVAALRHAWQHRPEGHVPAHLVAASALVEQRMALRIGEPAWAGEVAERTRRLIGDSGELRVLRAAIQVHRGRGDSARRLLAPLLLGEVGCVVPATLVEAWIWEARLAGRSGEEVRAHAAIAVALRLAAEHEFLRPFVSAGQEVHDLLARGTGRFGRLDALAARIRAAASPSGPEGLEALTTRELELLVELPSLRTADEIAASMYVSVNTVKTHLRGIYRKLGVNSRREAIVLARRNGLL